jgi:hypothetical protein
VDGFPSPKLDRRFLGNFPETLPLSLPFRCHNEQQTAAKGTHSEATNQRAVVRQDRVGTVAKSRGLAKSIGILRAIQRELETDCGIA